MLDLPGVVVAEPVGQFDLVKRVLIQLKLAVGLPWARQLQLVENAEFHSWSFPSVIPANAGSQSHRTVACPGCPPSRA